MKQDLKKEWGLMEKVLGVFSNNNKLVCLGFVLLAGLVVLLSFITMFQVASVKKSILNTITKIEAERVGGEDNYKLLQQLLTSDEYKENQREGLLQSLEQLGILGDNVVDVSDTMVSDAETIEGVGKPSQYLSQFKMGRLDGNMLDVVLSEDFYSISTKGADVAWIEYSDMECSYCRQLHNSGLAEHYAEEGRVDYIYKHFPLTSMHPNAEDAAMFIECVGKEYGADKYFATINNLYHRSIYKVEDMRQYIEEDDMDYEKLLSCSNNNSELRAKINNSLTEGQRIFGITGTPGTVLINKTTGTYLVIKGVYPPSAFEEGLNFVESQSKYDF